MCVGGRLPEPRERVELLELGPVHHSLAEHLQARFLGVLPEECGCHVRARVGVLMPVTLGSARHSSKIRVVEEAGAPRNEDPGELLHILA
eukprot:CAMPEP_0179293858 /NCGR_PEP_ID=MMETSP0797-20121207/43592_1 /TAXON_ID=47934 /ORGANISM="Dinophysis acuminata, Strain DAEP01" /LENGTH=89 /DNA_ID=CAMNT_0021003023 /DNA_START=122 /DNA_END=388 /DNA_ORIENTATION=-